MRILFCTNSLGAYGGIERVTIVKANALADIEGNEVTVCYTDRGTYPESTVHPVSEKVKTFDLGVPFWDLYPLGLKQILVTAPRKMLALRRALKRLIADFRPDVVISTGSYEKYALATIRLKRPAVKIREYHFNSHYRKYSGASPLIRLAGWVDNRVLGRFFHRNYLLTAEDAANFRGKRRYDYQYNPCSFISDMPVTPAAERRNVVLAIGRLEAVKNFGDLIRIWASIQEQAPGWELWIAGDGSELQQLKELADSLGAKVKMLGWQSDARSLMLQCKIMAVTSLYEGFPLNMIEALHCGIVPVAWAYPYGARELVTNDVDGLVTDYRDRDQLASALLSLIRDPERLCRLSAAGPVRASDFEPTKIAAVWMDKYRELIRSRN